LQAALPLPDRGYETLWWETASYHTVREFKTKQPGEQTNNNKKQKTKQVKQPTIPNKGETTYIYIYKNKLIIKVYYQFGSLTHLS
jgi:hypothetical protein